MPQANEEQRKNWGDGPDGIVEGKAIKYLEDHGYKLQKNWFWKLPTPNHQITDSELQAIGFLIDEQDFGGVVR